MANFKRKRPKEYTIHDCGSKRCKYDRSKFRGNGRDRFLPSFWKKFDGSHPWRYYNNEITTTLLR